jgi:hypothetical protein
VVRVDLEDRLRCRGDASGAGEQPLKLAVGAVLGSDEADRTVDQPIRTAHVRHRSPSVALMKAMKSVVAPSAIGASCLASSSGIAARSAAPWVTDLNGWPSKDGPDVTQKLSTESGR